MNPVRLILDTSAVAAYPSVHVREPIGEVYDSDASFGVPVAALPAAAAQVKDHDRVAALMREPGFVALELTVDRWRQIAATLELVGWDVAIAHVVIAAGEADCEILSRRPELYRALSDDDPPVIPLG